MSNLPSQLKKKDKPHQFKSKKRKGGPPIQLEIDGELFLLKPRVAAKALEASNRAAAQDLNGVFDFLKLQMVEREIDGQAGTAEPDGSSFKRFMDLDLDAEDLMDLYNEDIGELYQISMGESQASSTSSDDDEAKSSPISDASTPSTSTKLKSA